MQISRSSISACDNAFHLKFWGWPNWSPAMLHTKFQVSICPGTCFSKIQIWPKSAVNCALNVYSVSFSLFGFKFRVMWDCFSDVFGLPYRLASLLICHILLIYIMLTKISFIHPQISKYIKSICTVYNHSLSTHSSSITAAMHIYTER